MHTENNIYETLSYADHSSSKQRNSLKIYLDKGPAEGGKPISSNSIDGFTLHESIFFLLPFAELSLKDFGAWRENGTIRTGKRVYIEFSNTSEGNEDALVRGGFFRIWSYTQETLSSEIFFYNISLIYDCIDLFNSIIPFPQDPKREVNQNSAYVIETICNTLGLTPRIVGTPSDNMNWFNPGLTVDNFISLVLDHANFGNNDFPFFGIDFTGTATYGSVRSIFEDSKKLKVYRYDRLINDMTEKSSKELEGLYNPHDWIAILTNFKVLDYGGMTNFWANTVETIAYDANRLSANNPNEELWTAGRVHRAVVTHSIREGDKDVGDLENRETIRTRIRNGYYFNNTHKSWGESPFVNRMNKLEFFLHTYWLRFDLSKQPLTYFEDPPTLGTLLSPDFSTTSEIASTVQNVDLLIYNINTTFYPDHNTLFVDVKAASNEENASPEKGI